MRCLFLDGRHAPNCSAGTKIYAPSSFELQEYCRSDRHKVCPFYMRLTRRPRVTGLFAANSEMKQKRLRNAVSNER